MQDDVSATLAYPVDLRRISTPREHCLMLGVGPIDDNVVIEAVTKRFDQLPVLDRAGTLCGLVAVKHARELLDEGRPLVESDTKLDLAEIEERPSLISLLAELSDHRAVIFRDTQDQSERRHSDDWFALVTISDLNRHPFRAHLYPILAELEASLAELIDRRFEDPWTWLKLLNEEKQAGLIGRWELEKRRNVDTSPITGCTLTEMITVVSKSKDLREAHDYKSTKEFDKIAGSIPTLRNQIMHPVRPFILGKENVDKLLTTLGNILDLTRRVSVLNTRFATLGLESQRVLP